MIRTSLAFSGALLSAALIAPSPYQGSDLARRVTSSPDGLVKMTYAARDGICGDGRSFIADATSSAQGLDVWFTDGMSVSTIGDLRARCTRGPVRLLLVVRDHRVVDVQPFVGPASPSTERAGTALGTVPVAQIARYLLDLAATGRDDIAREAILAASIADSVRIAGDLATIARNTSVAPEVREQSLRWLGRVGRHEGDRDALRVARTILEDRDDRTDVRERAIKVIGEEDDGLPYLRAVYPRLDEPSLRERVVRTMADIGDSESRRWLRGIVERPTESASVRERAIRSLAEQGDLAYLRSAYRTLDGESLRDRVLRSVAEGGGSETRTWLRTIVRDPNESSGLRDRAVRSLAESGVQTTELVSLYDAVTDRAVRDRLVNLLAERGDRAARDKLRSIATDDPDEDLRRRATRKLAESK